MSWRELKLQSKEKAPWSIISLQEIQLRTRIAKSGCGGWGRPGWWCPVRGHRDQWRRWWNLSWNVFTKGCVGTGTERGKWHLMECGEGAPFRSKAYIHSHYSWSLLNSAPSMLIKAKIRIKEASNFRWMPHPSAVDAVDGLYHWGGLSLPHTAGRFGCWGWIQGVVN